MKKLLLIGMVLCSIFAANALTFRQTAACKAGLNPMSADTATITFVDRIMALHLTMCSKASRDVVNYRMVDYTNYTQFSSSQFIEFYSRGLNSGLQNYIVSQMLASANVQNNGINCTDTQLETSYMNVMFGVIKLIGNGSL